MRNYLKEDEYINTILTIFVLVVLLGTAALICGYLGGWE